MKNLLVLAATLVISQLALARTDALNCQSVPVKPDAGYALTFSPKMDKVIVQENTIRGPQTIATLVCSTNKRIGSSHPDQMSVWNCSEPKIRDGGYTVVLTIGGIAGFHRAELSEQTIMGPKNIADLNCR